MYRTTLLLPQTLFSLAKSQASKEGITVSDLIRSALKSYLARGQNTEALDPFFSSDTVFYGDGPTDVAENHDYYLYGEGREKSKRETKTRKRK